jgi:hypothetical protein
MTLELNEVSAQVKAMGQSLADQGPKRDEAARTARELLKQFTTEFGALNDRIQRADRVQQLRFDWVGAAPTTEPLNAHFPLPPCPEQFTIIASDGSQILPNRHAITLYYLINVGSIEYRHGSGEKPQTHNLPPQLFYAPEDVLDAQGRLISPGEVNVKRDLAELRVLVDLAAEAGQRTPAQPVVTLMDGQLSLRVIDLPFNQQHERQKEYIEMLQKLSEIGAVLAGYVDRPRSTFVLALLHLASLEPAAINEENLRQNPFLYLTDLELFNFLGPGERSAMFAVKGKNYQIYDQHGQGLHFFYLNVSANPADPHLARVEIPAWLAADTAAVDTLHAAIVDQARITGGYPYVLTRADELAVISGEEHEALEMMLALEMRRWGLRPEISLKQFNKNAYRAGKESFKL